MKRQAIFLGAAALLLAGCSQCLIMRSEYYDITGKVFASKPETEGLEILARPVGAGAPPSRPYQEIGVVKVMARSGTPKEALDKEMKKRARAAGADALTDAQYAEDPSNDSAMCGRLFATKRNTTATARAVVYTDESAVAVEERK